MRYIASLLCLCWFPLSTFAIKPEAVKSNKKGVEELTKDTPSPYLAYKHFIEALNLEPYNPVLKLNLGLSYQVNEEYDKAYKEYLGAFKYAGPDNKIKFMAQFNAGNLKEKKKDIPGALKHYQLALEYEPESKETKTNIELLMQQGGQGGGGGQDQDKKDDNQEGQGQNPDPNPQSGDEKKKEKKPFQGKKLSEKDVQKILEELKSQEQKIRAKEYGKQLKETPNGKDW